MTADRTIGRILEWLDSRGDFDDALIVVTSDHGEHLGEAGRFSHQLSMERELLRVPLIIRYPIGTGGGRVEKQTVSLMDLYPTLLGAAGIPLGEDVGESSRSFAVDLEAGALGKDRVVLSELHYSSKYLAGLRRRNPDFEVEKHAVIRRSWFVDGGEYRFEDSRLVAAASTGHQGLIERNDAYSRSLEEGVSDLGPRGEDGESVIEELRALGYVD